MDTSEAWFEPRRRRIAISAAGPVSDFSLGALFAICCLVLPDGTVRDIFFNLAFAAYVGAFFNLNPFIDRDGYHILVDVLREPGLRRRAKEQFQRRLSGKGVDETDSPVLARYSIFGVGWFVLAGFLVIGITLRYKPIMSQYAADYVVWAVLITLWVGVLHPCHHRPGAAADGRASAESEPVATSEADIAAHLIERLLGDPTFRAAFRRDPAARVPRCGARQPGRRDGARRGQGDDDARRPRVQVQPGRRDDGRRHGGRRHLPVRRARAARTSRTCRAR